MNDKKFAVWCPDQGEDEQAAREVWAYDEGRAAEEWARREDCDSADYWIVGGGGTDVVVRGEDGVTKHMRVNAEPDICYTSREIIAATPAGQKDGSEAMGGET